MFEPRFPAWRWPLAAVLGLVSVLGAAQTQPSSDSPVPSTRTSIPAGEWDALMRPLPEPERKAEPPATARPDDLKALVEAERQTQVEQLVRRADQFRAFRQNYPDDKNAQEARRQEGLLLLQAAFSGEQTQVARRRQLVADVLADTSLPAEDRFEVAAYAGNLTVEQGTFASPADRLAAFERVARDLVARFPEVPAGYEVELARTLDVPPGGDRFTTNTADTQPVAARDLACRVSVGEGGTTVAVTLAAPSWAIVVLRPGGR